MGEEEEEDDGEVEEVDNVESIDDDEEDEDNPDEIQEVKDDSSDSDVMEVEAEDPLGATASPPEKEKSSTLTSTELKKPQVGDFFVFLLSMSEITLSKKFLSTLHIRNANSND